ncbi:MAG TPA: HAMP domain-containing sensor histidine kinase [Candidatus Angelobacter sp.]|nr:HAMP domain-containing sensor histidine kinase [Candidatus Angelobacter sp.]
MSLRPKLSSTGHSPALWPFLLLVLVAVLVPTAGVLWFMSQAVEQQRDVARQRLSDAYRGQLALLRDRLDVYWEKRAADLAIRPNQGTPPQVFRELVRTGLADSVIFLGTEGSVAYPAPVSWPTFGPSGAFPFVQSADPAERSSDWIEAQALESKRDSLASAAAAYAHIASKEKDDAIVARAVQAQVRCLVQSGNKDAAVFVIQRQFGRDHLSQATDRQGRIVAADEQLLVLNLLSREDRRYLAAARRLHTILADYEHSRLPSAQRLFLMEEMRALKLGDGLSEFPTYDAEALAARFLEADRARPGDAALRLSGVPDIWKLTSTDGHIIGLYRGETVLSSIRHFLDEQNSPKGLQFAVIPPGGKGPHYDEETPAGPHLPGWQLTLALKNTEQFDAIAKRQMASYVWIGFLVITAMALLALVIGQALRRQMRLASLKTDLVAAVSHELKTPLSSMRLLVDSLLDDQQFDPQKTREYLELIANENSRLSRLIDNFLTFSRMERNRQKFNFEETTPARIVQSALEAAGERFHSNQRCLEVKIAPGLPPLHADEDAMVTALLNLLDNAYKFTPEQKRIVLRAFCDAGRVCFEVTDNGIGLSPREQKKVFRRFYQVDRQLARQAGGVGLGLSIVEFIVKAHKGNIQVRSQPGAGSTFTVSLPSSEIPQPSPAEEEEATA